MTTENTKKKKGEMTYTCSVCGAIKTEELSTSGGLGGGAIAAISIASTTTVLLGGFSLFWFVIKKKKLSDLVK